MRDDVEKRPAATPLRRRTTWRTLLVIGVQVACRLVGAGAAVVLNLVMARNMPPDEVGHALAAMSAGVLGALLASGGIEAAAVRFLPGYLALDRTGAARGYLRFGVGQALLIGFAVGLTVALGLAWAASDDPALWPLAAAVPAAAMLGLGRVLASQSLGFGRPLAASIPMQLVRPVTLLAGVALIVAMTPSPTALGVMACFAASIAVAVVVQAALTVPLHRSVRMVRSDYGEWRQWVTIGLQLGAGAIFLEFGRDLAIAVAPLSLGPAEVAQYAVAIRIVGLVKFSLVAVNQNFMPALSAAVARSDDETVARLTSISNHLKFWPVLGCFVALYFAGPPIVALFGPAYDAAATLILILMLEPLLMATLGPAPSLLAFGRHYVVILSTTLAAAALLVAGVVAGGHAFGAVGASWAIVVAWAFWCGVLAVQARRRLGIDSTIIGSVLWTLAQVRKSR